MHRFNLWFKNNFGFSQKEINGFLVLLFIMVLLIVIPLFIPSSSPFLTVKRDQAILDSILASVKTQTSQESKKYASNRESKIIQYKRFNPNTCSVEEWKQFGVSEKIAQRILNYLDKGGQFRKKSDLQKIYGFPKKQYSKLAPYILIPKKIYPKNNYYAKKGAKEYRKKDYFKAKEIEHFEINSCTPSDLIQIRGIGEKLSERILKYRDNIGGFYSKSQYTSIYGLDSSVITQLNKYATIDEIAITKININTATYKELKAHLLIHYKIASAIVNYRTQHGNYSDVSDLRNIYSITKEDYIKIEPYLKAE